MFEFEIYDNMGKGKRYRVQPGTYSIGKGDQCDIVLNDTHLSRHHADLVVTEDNSAYLKDANSTNGIWRNGERMNRASIPLEPGVFLVLGHMSLALPGSGRPPKIESPPPPSAASAPPAAPKASLFKKITPRIISPKAEPEPAASSVAPTDKTAVAVAVVPTEKNETTETPVAVGTEKPVISPNKITSEPKQPPKTDALEGTPEVMQFKRAIHSKLLEYLDLHRRSDITNMSNQELRKETTTAINEVIKQENLPVPKGVKQAQIVQEIVAEAIGLGPIEPYLEDESISEIMVNGPDQIYIERGGRLQKGQARFSTEYALLSAIERIVSPLGRRIDEGSPMVDARLEDGSRVNAIIPPLALDGPALTIRKFSKRKLGIQDLIQRHTINEEMAKFMEVCVKYRRNIMVSGGTGSGKTTTLNILSNFIPEHERIVTIEDSAELQLNQEHVVRLESRPANIEGKGEITIRDLVKNCLRMRPDRIVVGECRGGEALDMLQAMNTGHDGSLTTGHANSPRDFLSRLEVMVLMSGIDLPVRAIREQIASAVDIILQQTRFSDGSRRVTSIVEVDGMEGDIILLQTIFSFQQTGISAEGKVLGDFIGHGYAPSFYTKLREEGVELDHSIFQKKTLR